jgi:hypothetical protein
VDAFVCGAGTGGTVGGVGRFLKEASGGACRVHVADPPGSVLLRLVNEGCAWTPALAERTLRRHRSDASDLRLNRFGVGLGELRDPAAAATAADPLAGADQQEIGSKARDLRFYGARRAVAARCLCSRPGARGGMGVRCSCLSPSMT